MAIDVLLTLLGAAALIGRVGFAVYAAGLVRSKNSAGTVTRALCDLCVVSLAFWAVGASILIHIDKDHSPYFSVDKQMMFGSPLGGNYTIFFHLAMILLASGAVVGVVAERFKFFPLCAASAVLAGFLLPTTCQWAWTGWLRTRGFIDVGGAASLHFATGVFAAVAAALVGARTGKFNRDGSSTMIPGHNVPLVAIGAMLLLAGWAPYVMGASIHTPKDWAERIAGPNGMMSGNFLISGGALNTLLAAAGAGLAALLLGQLRYGKPDVVLAIMGTLGGLVAVTGGAGALTTPAAVFIGVLAGILVPLTTVYIDLHLRIDDPTGMIAVYGVGGALGSLSVSFFARLPSGAVGPQLGRQAIGLLAIGAFSGLIALVLFLVLKSTVGIRTREGDEFEGLDLAEHDIGAYPDFQQTMIKSYHLREV